ncbi:MAG: winged helix-turn-helix domain-containing protein [Pyrobaculum sp.]
MNVTVALILLPLSLWTATIAVPPNATAVVYANLPQFCNATGVYELRGPAAMYITCVNTGTGATYLSGHIAVEYRQPPLPQVEAAAPPLAAVAAAVAAAAGLSHLFSNRREWLIAPILFLARIKTAKAEAPVRREILAAVEKMGAATLAQIAKTLGRSWGAVQWHVYVLEREGRLKSVKIGPFTYYYINPRAAAEVILSSVDPTTLSPEDREKLEFMAS